MPRTFAIPIERAQWLRPHDRAPVSLSFPVNRRIRILGIPPVLEPIMAKGQRKKSREARKPKQEKVKTNASNPSLKPGAIRGLENMKNS